MNKIPSMFSKKPVVIFSALTLLALFGVFQLPKAQAGYYGITPTSATVAVGSSVQFHLYDSSGGSDQEVTLTDGDKMTADPFYVKKGDLSGSLVGVNPGVVTVYYNAGSTFGTVKATLTVTGSQAVTTGKIKITASKEIYYQMYPVISGCDVETGVRCRQIAVPSYQPDNFIVNDSFDPPVLMGSWYTRLFRSPAKGNETGPWPFTLADPMNPVPAPFANAANYIDTDTDWAGDFAWALLTQGVAFSKDGTYQFDRDSYGRVDGWHNGIKRDTLWGGNGTGSFLDGVIDRGYKTFVITDQQTFDVTDFDKIPKVFVPYRYQYNNDGTPIPCTAGCSGSYRPGSLPSLPSGFPIMPNGRKFILSNDNYVADFVQRNVVAGFKNELAIYDLGQPNPVATLGLSSDIFTGPPGQPSQFPSYYFRQKIDADTDYLVMIVKPSILRTCTLPTFNQPSVCTPKDPIPYSEANYGSEKVFVYKFTFSTKTLTKIVNGALLDPGMVTAATGFNVGGQKGVLVSMSMGLDYDATGFPTRYEGRTRAYLYTDLAAGTTADVLANGPVNSRGGADHLTSLVSGDSTYVYSFDWQGAIYVWKLDLTTSPSLAICQDSTALNHGGTLPCRYPPRPRPACSPGDPFSTDTGLPCSGATGTGRKLSCVNLSSNFYCSNGQVQGATAFHFTQWIALGSNGNEVIELQKFLNNAGYYTDVADGNFGAKTEAAVIKLQTANGLKGDGIVGPATRAVLNK